MKRSLIEEERTLAFKLGLEAVRIDEDTIPDKEDITRVEDNLRGLTKIKEERETRMFTMKEHIVAIMETLGMDMNATMLSLALDGEDDRDSLKLTDLRSIQHTMDELKRSLEHRKVEVQELLKDITSLYTRLNIPELEQCPLSTGRVCGEEDLVHEEKFHLLKEEKMRLERIKIANMKIIVGNAKSELFDLWEACMVGEEERGVFLNNLNDNADGVLSVIENEISRFQNYQRLHKDTFSKLSTFVGLCDLADDLKERMKDPNRLFKSRGKAMVKEEEDRKKVNTIPNRKAELLALAEHKGNLLIYDEMMSTYVEDQARVYEELFPSVSSRVKSKQSSSLSSTKSGKSFTTPMLGNKTASPRSTKKLGKSYKSPVPRASNRALRTAQSNQNSRRGNRMTDSSPIDRPSKRMIRSNTTLDRVDSRKQNPNSFHDGTINESAFSENVPYNSTVCMNTTTTKRTMLPVITVDTENDNTVVLSGLIDQLVAARDAAVLQDITLRQQNPVNCNVAANKPGPSAQISSQDRSSIKAARKLRRSNSCSDLSLSRWKQQGEQRKRLTSRTESKENLASIRCVGFKHPCI